MLKGIDDQIHGIVQRHHETGHVQKAPAATLSTLAEALKQIYAKVNPKYGETEVRVIGTRHGEKLYETLVTREEMSKAIDMGNYYRIPCDTPCSMADSSTLPVPMTFVRVASIGKNSHDGTCFNAAAAKT